jgi:uncharacterized protein YjbI with pentapeptide repeats
MENLAVSLHFSTRMKLQLAAAIITGTTALVVTAADTAKLEILRTTNACKYCDLTDANLSGTDLRGADFQNANLAGANLSKADLSQRPMEKRTLSTNFESANLKKTNLSEAKLNGANFLNAFLRDTNLEGAVLLQPISKVRTSKVPIWTA